MQVSIEKEGGKTGNPTHYVLVQITATDTAPFNLDKNLVWPRFRHRQVIYPDVMVVVEADGPHLARRRGLHLCR